MTALDPDVALNRGIQLSGIHVAPSRQLHDAPADCRAAPAVIVRAGNDSEVQRVGEREYASACSLNYADAFRRAVTELDGIQSGEAVQLVVGNLGDVTRNGEDQHRDSPGYGNSGIACRVVPVALRVECECRVYAKGDDVFVLIACFQRWQQHCCISSPSWIRSHARARTG